MLPGKGIFLDIDRAEKRSEDVTSSVGGAGQRNTESWETGASKGSVWQFFSRKDEKEKDLPPGDGRCVLCARFEHAEKILSSKNGSTNMWNHLKSAGLVEKELVAAHGDWSVSQVFCCL